MPRKPRIHYPGAVYHVILRGNAGQDVFFQDRDYFRLYLFLQESVERFCHHIHGFCCMVNHVHLLVQVQETPLPLIMQNISQRYTKWINFSQNRTGHVFQGRYKALLVDADSYLLELMRYVHLNPVRAGVVARPELYRWSSHNAYLGNEVLPWLTTEWVLSHFSRRTSGDREAYVRFVADGTNDGRRELFHTGTCEGRILGDDSFVDETLVKSEEQLPPKWTLPEVIEKVCHRYGVTKADLKAQGKARDLAEARALAAIIVQQAPHLTLTELGRFLQRSSAALGQAAQRMLLEAGTNRELAAKIETIRAELQRASSSPGP